MRSRSFYLTIFALLATTQLGGCKLIDQRTFDSHAGRPPSPPPPPAQAVQAPKAPFLSIADGTAESEYGPVVDHAARVALQHKSNVLFIVRALTPPQPTVAEQQALLAKLSKGLLNSVSQKIIAAGAKPLQLELHAETDVSVHTPVVRVELR
ncbi:hypothetical protein AA106555_1322 [Neokomagataea thailandica NBRC 106555]|uniref:Uncharacterized protein n=2 Tax=Neokomagataea TaxID=1223423 RepID=A0A4Y6V921_9PROT|nr:MULTISPECIES: hypothetical protein [Neokomagataea]QDH25388.1 hypothetical protein D5366_09375 [Neokomagataea tanensis]GBR53505.1 hypothetical protein AA106555_1322 [Neokomagataea thailandica NBRC 106555]